jgi:hypothetical protein
MGFRFGTRFRYWFLMLWRFFPLCENLKIEKSIFQNRFEKSLLIEVLSDKIYLITFHYMANFSDNALKFKRQLINLFRSANFKPIFLFFCFETVSSIKPFNWDIAVWYEIDWYESRGLSTYCRGNFKFDF